MTTKHFLFLLMACTTCCLQVLSQPLSRGYNPTNRSLSLEADYFTPGQSRIYSALSTRNYSGLPDQWKAVGNLPFNRLTFLTGYEMLFSDYWSAGANWQYNFTETDRTRRLQAYLQHNGSIGKVYFLKRLIIEDHRNRTQVFFDRGKIGLGMDLIWPFRIKNTQWQVAFQYTALQDQNWYNKLLPVENRFIDYTMGEISLGMLFKERFTFTLFAQRETFYYLGQPSFDDTGNMIDPERRVNIITPLIGIRLRAFFNTENAVPWVFPFSSESKKASQ